MDPKNNLKRYHRNWQDEIDAAYLYRVMARAEGNASLSKIYERLAQVEDKHAAFWGKQLTAAGQELPAARPSVRTRILEWCANHIGTQVVLPLIASAEKADQARYDDQPEASGTVMSSDERSHARVLKAMVDHRPTRGVEGSALARLEGRHHTISGNALRAAVLGANDGLLSNLSLIMGVAGASMSNRAIIVTGLAGLLAGASSMGLGEWISVQSSRELNQHEIEVESDELAEMPQEEEEELALIYESKGLPADQAKTLARQMMSDQTKALDTLTREELGIDPNDLGGSPWEAAITSFALFATGAIFPVLPFIFSHGQKAVISSLGICGVGLFLIGIGIAVITGRPLMKSGMRQLVFGLAAASLTYGIGKILGVSIAG